MRDDDDISPDDGASEAPADRRTGEADRRRWRDNHAFLLRFSDSLRAEPQADAIAERAIAMLADHLAIDRCCMIRFHFEEDRLDITHRCGDIGPPLLPPSLSLSDFPAAVRLAADKTVVISDFATAPDLTDVDRTSLVALGAAKAFIASILRHGEHNPLWGIVAISAEPRQWRAYEVRLMEEATERAWAAIERARAEQALRESEARLTAIIESAPVGIVMLNPDGNMVFANPEAHRLFPSLERPIIDAERRWRWRSAYPDGKPVLPEDYPGMKALRGISTIPGAEFIYQDDDNDPQWMTVASAPIRAPDGTVSGAVSVINNIDALRRSQAALAETEARYRSLFQSLDEGVTTFDLILDVYGRCVDVLYRESNGALTALTGLTNLEGRRGSEVTPTLGREYYERFERVARTGQAERYEYRSDDLGGRWFDIHVSRVGGDGSRTLVIVYSNITERKHAEQALRESGAQQSFLLGLGDRLRPISDEAKVRGIGCRLLGEQVKASHVYCIEYEPDGDIGTIAGDYSAPGLPSLSGQHPFDAIRSIYDRLIYGDSWMGTDIGDDAELNDDERAFFIGHGARAAVGVPCFKDGRLKAFICVVQTVPRRWTAQEVDLIEEAGRRVWAAIWRSRAEQAVRDSEDRLRLILGELQHRVRNILTVVRSVFNRTIERGGPFEEVVDHFRGRLDSLARTQVVVTQTADGQVDLENLIREELLSVGAGDGPNLVIAGPDIALAPKAAETIGLAIHELTTNAVKYGALKVPGAQLAICWKTNLFNGNQPQLVLTWVEQGVPAIPVGPIRRGFGVELIEEALPYQLGAETKLEFRGGGIRCTISMPLPE